MDTPTLCFPAKSKNTIMHSIVNNFSAYSIPGLRNRTEVVVTARKREIIKNGKGVDFDHILDVVCEHFGVSREKVLGRSRWASICEARHIAIYLTYHYGLKTCVEVARLFNRDHTTVIHSLSIVNGYCEVEEGYRELLQQIQMKLL